MHLVLFFGTDSTIENMRKLFRICWTTKPQTGREVNAVLFQWSYTISKFNFANNFFFLFSYLFRKPRRITGREYFAFFAAHVRSLPKMVVLGFYVGESQIRKQLSNPEPSMPTELKGEFRHLEGVIKP